MNASKTVPIQKNVVLVGAGNAHLRFVRMFGMKPMPGVAVTLVSEAPEIPYSAMVPGCIAGDYTWHEITVDLVRLCRSANVRFVPERATRLDVGHRKVLFAGRPELSYDVLSLGVGSLPARPPGLNGSPSSWPMRPLAGLLQRLDRLEEQLRREPRSFHLVVVGGGASGCELTLAIGRRFSGHSDVRLTLVQSSPRLLPQFPEKAARIFTGLLQEKNVAVRLDARVTGGDEQSLELNGVERMAYDGVLWATNAAPPTLVQAPGLRLNEDGFLLVHDTLQSVSDPAVFGTGDCIPLESQPDLLKTGVYAVREGAILFDNVMRFLNDRPLVP